LNKTDNQAHLTYIPVLEPSLLAPRSMSTVGVSSASKSAFAAPVNGNTELN